MLVVAIASLASDELFYPTLSRNVIPFRLNINVQTVFIFRIRVVHGRGPSTDAFLGGVSLVEVYTCHIDSARLPDCEKILQAKPDKQNNVDTSSCLERSRS